jgi:hypothetical protein
MATVTTFSRFSLVGFLLAGLLLFQPDVAMAGDTIHYTVDPAWPKLPLPNNWAMGEIGGMEVDDQDHVWIIQRPRTLASWELGASTVPPRSECCVPAPPVIEFDPQGRVGRSWGGPGEGYDWPMVEHGITLDHQGYVWIGGSSTREGPNGEPTDGMVLKFTADGEFVMQIGSAGATGGSLDPTQLSGAADIAVHPPTNEVFIADGYGNHRVIVFDASSGEFKRMWGAYGHSPTDDDLGPYDPAEPPAKQFRTAHCITVAQDGTVFLCDRDNNRVQVFTADGEFLHEYVYQSETLPPGTVGHLSLWPPETEEIMAITDLGNFKIRLVSRMDGKEIGSFGHFGNFAGQLNRVHQADFDSAGNIFTAEAAGKRIQRWVRSNQ